MPFPSPGDLPNPGIKPKPPALPVDSLPLSHQGSQISFSRPGSGLWGAFSPDLANSNSGCWLYLLIPWPSACPLLPSGGLVGPAELGFGQALCKTLIERHILQRVNLASAAAGRTLHSSRPRMNAYSSPNTKTKNNAKTSTL